MPYNALLRKQQLVALMDGIEGPPAELQVVAAPPLSAITSHQTERVKNKLNQKTLKTRFLEEAFGQREIDWESLKQREVFFQLRLDGPIKEATVWKMTEDTANQLTVKLESMMTQVAVVILLKITETLSHVYKK